MINILFILKKKITRVYRIRGQSNAVGSYTGSPSESYLLTPIQNVFIWSGTTWDILEYSVNNKGYRGVDHGIELMLGYLLQQKYKEDIYIVKNARGGSSLAVDWAENGADYLQSVTDYNNAINNLISSGKNPTLISDYWNHGEADAANQTYSNSYQTNLQALINRSKINNSKFIITRLSSLLDGFSSTYPYREIVRTAQETICPDYINQDDLHFTTINSTEHFDSESQNILATRFFNKL